MWTYLNTPFLLAWPGADYEERSPWKENGESWRRLSVRYPSSIATHSSKQTLYVDKSGLLKRHDYDVEIAGDILGAHYIDTSLCAADRTCRSRSPHMPDFEPKSRLDERPFRINGKLIRICQRLCQRR
jgi:hypothetical protein